MSAATVLVRLIRRTEREITALYQRYVSGAISRTQFVAASAAVLSRARARGVTLADLSVSLEVARHLRRPLAPVGLRLPANDQARLRNSVSTVLGAEVDYVGEQLQRSRLDRLQRLGRDGTAEAAAWGMGEAMTAHGVPGWTRWANADACELCMGWADGIVRSPDVEMLRHRGCSCIQMPAF